MIGIIDYGMGNIHSVQKALEFLGGASVVVRDPASLKKYQKLVLPGVGAFDDAVIELKKQGLIPAIKESIKNRKPILGICLGLQLFFESSQEAKTQKGLGILKGKVVRFAKKAGLKVPHMGWNQLRQVTRSQGHKVAGMCPLLKNISDNAYVYFCHSYYVVPKDKDVIAADTSYGVDFTAVICKDNIYGVQFHPEKSQDTGLKILKNFIEL